LLNCVENDLNAIHKLKS